MGVKEIKVFQTECGKKFYSKQAAKKHDESCTCWKNPNQKTCVTCKFGVLQNDSNGMEHEPRCLQTWKWWDCKNPEWNYDLHFQQAPNDKTESLCINCPKHSSNKILPDATELQERDITNIKRHGESDNAKYI